MLLASVAPVLAQSEAPPAPRPAAQPEQTSKRMRLAKDYDIWIDLQRKEVIVGGEICLREGQLEMFACPRYTKEHESIVSLNCPARFVHAALLAVGAEPGRPVQFEPEYRPASGPVIDVLVRWKDPQKGWQEVRAQEWVKHLPTGKAMPYDWVFAGSGFWVDEQTGQRHYWADGGELICVSNFPTATLDLPVRSSQDNDKLLFAAFTERIPPLKTPVEVILRPRLPGQRPRAAGGDAPAQEAPPKPPGKKGS